jgi:hypothetical protein
MHGTARSASDHYADIDEFSFGSPEWVASRRWAATGEFHHLPGVKRPKPEIRRTRRPTFERLDLTFVVAILSLLRGTC